MAKGRESGYPPLILRAVAVGYVLFLVALPLGAMLARGLSLGTSSLWEAVSAPMAASAIWLSLWTALAMALLNALMGTATAWVLVHYEFPGKSLLNVLIDLPFAIPTLVTGIVIVILFGPQSAMGGFFTSHGMPITYAAPAIFLAITFITFPFVVRAVEPILIELDPAEEEAAQTLGASKATIFFKIILPPLLPAIGCGMVQSFARALAEFGSVAVVSGNMPMRTLTASVYVYGEIEGGRAASASAVSLVLLGIALLLVLATRQLSRMAGMRNG